MTAHQIELLRMSINGVDYYKDISEPDRAVLRYLAEEGLVRTASLDDTVCCITERGRAELDKLDKSTKQHAEDKRQQRFQNKISVLNVFIPLITFIIGLIIEHFSSIISRLLSLFH